MTEIALRMLWGERARYGTLVGGICFATLLMTLGLALFFGLMTFHYSIATNIRAPIWVTDPQVQHVADFQPLRDTDVDRVRSVEGVAWAAPLHVGNTQARLVGRGVTRPVTLVGLDATTLAGAPTRFVAGRIDDLRRAQGVIVEEGFLLRLAPEGEPPLGLGEYAGPFIAVAGRDLALQDLPAGRGIAFAIAAVDHAHEFRADLATASPHTNAVPAVVNGDGGIGTDDRFAHAPPASRAASCMRSKLRRARCRISSALA